jgi:hypothetical protein
MDRQRKYSLVESSWDQASPKTSADEIRKIVDDHHTNPLGPPKVIRETTPTAKEMRHLLVLLFRVFGALFSRDTKELRPPIVLRLW